MKQKKKKKLTNKDITNMLKKKYQEIEVPKDVFDFDAILKRKAKEYKIPNEEKTRRIIETGVKEKIKKIENEKKLH